MISSTLDSAKTLSPRCPLPELGQGGLYKLPAVQTISLLAGLLMSTANLSASSPLSFLFNTEWSGTLTGLPGFGSFTYPLQWNFFACKSNALGLCATDSVSGEVQNANLQACYYDGSTLIMEDNGQTGTFLGVAPGITTLTGYGRTDPGCGSPQRSQALTEAQLKMVPPLIVISSGNQQPGGSAGKALKSPLTVKVTDSFGNPESGVPITFEITQQPAGASGTSLTTDSVATGAGGTASTGLTLGTLPGQYQVTASCINCNPPSVAFTETAACQADVELNHVERYLSLSGLPVTMFAIATFNTPANSTLPEYAQSCGYVGFDWTQTVIEDVTARAISEPACVNAGGVATVKGECSVAVAPLIPPFSDPPLGGYTYEFAPSEYPLLLQFQPNFAAAYPFYYSPLDVASGSGCALYSVTCDIPIVVGNNTLNFYDSPHNSSCSPPAPCIGYRTQLVGICEAPSPTCSSPGPSAPLFQWTWYTNFNGSVGGIYAEGPANFLPPDPGSGTGGVTITSINGVQLPTPILSSQVATTASGLAYSRVSQTFNGTVTLTNISSSAISGPLQILFTGMPFNVTLANETGDLSGTPYMTVPSVATLAPGQSVTVECSLRILRTTRPTSRPRFIRGASINVRKHLPLLLASLFCFGSLAAAGPITCDVTVNTSSISGRAGSLDFNFNPGPLVTQSASLQILNFTSNATLAGSPPLTGDVAGALPATLTFDNGAGFNDYFEGFTFGTTLAFQVSLFGLALSSPDGVSTSGSTFAFGMFSDAAGTMPALTTDTTDGFAFTVDVNLNGTTTVTNSSAQTTIVAAGGSTVTPEPGTSLPMALASGLWLFFRFRLRRRQLI